MIHPQMEVREGAWAGRGRPRREVPADVRELADATYGTGQIVMFTDVLTDDDRARVREVLSYARTYAGGLGRRIRIQPQSWARSPHSEEACQATTVMFEMVDGPAPRVPSPRRDGPQPEARC